ncbi:MAG TPA: FKBP-type peptidyl-prolyl cis-trans isomerase, partial [Fimbriimonadaceae bacterium]|nr:FKBP-type peptidyl-prolyl cis-trans isomerase [Fimbriimonadaceae bacterium]
TLADTHTGQGQPARYPVGSGRFPRGFDIAFIGMKAGGKRKVTVPPDLAFGAKGSSNGMVPPNASVILEIELVKIGQ